MEPEITVFDDKSKQIGKTFARRAKQLVGKGRAVWTDDSQRAIILAAGADASEIYAANDGSYKDLREGEEMNWEDRSLEEASVNDGMLRSLAEERVRRRKALPWHIVGLFFTAVFVFGFFLVVTNGFWRVQPIGWIMFGFCYGMMAVWGLWVVRQIAIIWRERSLRPDEVESEFQRLKSMQTK